jgi:RNA polymerase sigma factor FliA
MTFDAFERAELLERHMPEVHRIARQVHHKLTANVELDDLVQVGMIGLMDALQRYTHGESSFEAYAHYRIKGAIMDDLREKDHLPRAVRKMQKDFERQRQRLAHSLGREPTEQDVATALGVSPTELRKMTAQFEQFNVFSIEDLASDAQQASSLLDALAEPVEDCSGALQDKADHEALLGMLESLGDREQLVLRMYFEQEMTFKEIGSVIGVNESRAYQMHAAALGALREKAQRNVC